MSAAILTFDPKNKKSGPFSETLVSFARIALPTGHAPVPRTVFDPFLGSGSTTAVVAQRLGCRAIGIELNPDYCGLAAGRFRQRNLFARAVR